MENIIEIKDLSFGYDKTNILENINLTVAENDFLILSGNNGSGKSTLLKIMIGENTNFKGQIKLFGNDIRKFSDWKKIGYVPQVDRDNITNFPISVKEMVMLSLYNDFNFLNLPKQKHKNMVKDVLAMFDLTELKDKNFNDLSGGQKQRVMIAKAMVHNPDLLIFDEPTVGVDKNSKENFYHLIDHMYQHHNISIIMVTHESDMDIKSNYRKVILKEKELFEYV